MYQLVNAILRQHGKNKTWVSTDISLETLNVVFTKYNDGHLTLLNPVLSPNPIYVDFQELKNVNVPFINLPFETWLQSLVNLPLPTLSAEPTYTEKCITYSDASQAGFDITRIHPTFVFDECGPNPIFTNNQLRDLRLEKENVSLVDLQKYLLCTVNGFLHRSTPTETGLQIKDAALSVDVCNENCVGLISFKNIGEVTQHAIMPNMLKLVNGFPARYEYLIETNLDLNDKTVMLSLGGYLHLEDNSFDIVCYNPGVIRISFTRVNLIRRLLEMNKYLDLSGLLHYRSPNKGDAVNVLDFYKDTNISALLTMSQSFLIVVDTPHLYFEREIVGQSLFPNIYEYGLEPTVPLRTSTGRLPEYWRTLEHNTWVMSLSDTLQRNYLHETTEWAIDGNVNSRLQTDNGLAHGKAHLFYIKTKIKA